MKKKGIVVSAEGNNAHIRIQRESACGGNCASCASSCAKETVVTAFNKAGAAAGDYVELEMESSRVLGAAVLVYVIPLLMLVLGYFIVYFISNSESWGICAGFILMAAAYVVAAKIAKKNTNKYSLSVEKVIDK